MAKRPTMTRAQSHRPLASDVNPRPRIRQAQTRSHQRGSRSTSSFGCPFDRKSREIVQSARQAACQANLPNCGGHRKIEYASWQPLSFTLTMQIRMYTVSDSQIFSFALMQVKLDGNLH